MRALITGASGTVGQALRSHLEADDIEVVAWDRDAVSMDDYHAMEGYVREVQPNVLYHLAVPSRSTGRDNESWFVNYEWTAELAWIARVLEVRFIYTSSVKVFSDDATGPFTLASVPDASSGYGYEKFRAEQRTLEQNPYAIIARLGWQIGEDDDSNNMVSYLANQADAGAIEASTEWLPACSFLEDTASVLADFAYQPMRGLYQLDSNTGWSFYEIASAINQARDAGWTITPTDTFVFDQRMQDSRVHLPILDERLPALSPESTESKGTH